MYIQTAIAIFASIEETVAKMPTLFVFIIRTIVASYAVTATLVSLKKKSKK